MKNFFNPTLKEMTEEYQDITILGLFWAGLWRWYGLVIAISMGIGFIAILAE